MPPSAAWTRSFCERWLQKAVAYDENRLDEVFDRFFSTFVAFNRLYSHFNLMLPCPRASDREQATDGVLQAIGADALLRALTENGGDQDLRKMEWLMKPGGRFYLVSNATRDGPDEAKNLELHARLRSQDRRTRVKAILEYLYHIRCNMFHGSKDFDREQIQIVRPAGRSLERVVRAGLQVLR